MQRGVITLGASAQELGDVVVDPRKQPGKSLEPETDPLAEYVAEVVTDLGVQLRYPDRRGDGQLHPVVLRRRAQALIRLDPLPVVARVANWTASVREQPSANLAVEVALSRWAAEHGARVPVPLVGHMAGPHTDENITFTLWPVRAEGAGLSDPGLAGRALAELHVALARFPGELPGPEPIAADANRAMMLLARMGILDAEEAMLVADECRELLAEFKAVLAGLPAERMVPLHGDSHPGNASVVEGRVTWFDLEDAWRGPVEWDVAVLASSARWQTERQRELVVRQYSAAAELELDKDVLAACRRLRNAQAEAWGALAEAVAS